MAANANEDSAENEKFAVINSAEAAQAFESDDNKFRITSKAALMQVYNELRAMVCGIEKSDCE